jgi:hypothetical protein
MLVLLRSSSVEKYPIMIKNVMVKKCPSEELREHRHWCEETVCIGLIIAR